MCHFCHSFIPNWSIDLRVPGVSSLIGDYNNDGIVNAADYVVWRTNLGRTDWKRRDRGPRCSRAGDFGGAAIGGSSGSLPTTPDGIGKINNSSTSEIANNLPI